MTTITRENLIQILLDDPVLVEELRSLLLTRELLDLPQKLAEFAESVDRQFEAINQQFETINQRFEAIDQQFEAINQRFEAIDQQFEAINRRFEAIDKRFDSLETDVDQLKVDVGLLKGKSLEYELAGRVRSRVEHRFKIRRARAVRASTQQLPAHDFEDAVYDAENAGVLSESQRQRILDTDMVVQGRSLDTGKDTYVAVESSFTIADSDIVRANRTTAALRNVFPNADVWAAVYCSEISDENTRRAQDDGVEVISNARL